jgi:hypothetical protein
MADAHFNGREVWFLLDLEHNFIMFMIEQETHKL